MSFLDDLENNLKALESKDDGGIDERGRRDRERDLAIASAPWAERLKNAPFTQKIMQQATLAGRQRRIKVNLVWMGTTLRLEARGHRLELRPRPNGIAAVFLRGIDEMKQEPVDISGDPQKLTDQLMAVLDEQKRLDDEAAARALQALEEDEQKDA
jgi:hypothetical protein